MKKYAIFLLSLVFSIGSYAQKDWQNKSSEESAAMYVDKLDRKLSLTAEQKEEIRDLQMKRLETRSKMMEDRHDAMAGDAKDMAKAREDMREDHMKMMEDFRDEMREILNDEQYLKWEKMEDKEWRKDNKWKNKDKWKDKKMKKNSDMEDDEDEDDEW